MKKICLIFNHFQHQDGVGRSALAIANILVDKHLADVTLIPIYTDEKEFHKLLNSNVKVKHIFGFYFRGMPHIVDKLPLSWSNMVVKPHQFDVVVGFQFGLSIRMVSAFKVKNSISKFAWMHGYDYGLTLKNEYERIGKVVCVSRCNSERLHKELPSIVTDYSYNPIDEKLVQGNGAHSINLKKPSEGMLFVVVGRLSPEKGYGRLISIFERLKNEGYSCSLWIVGDGPLESTLHKQVKELGMENDVRFWGRQNNPHQYTALADVFICSSFSEGYSTVCTEAIMLGVPVITTNVSGAEEIIEDAECGMMTEMDDESLYNALCEVLQNPSIVSEWKKKLEITREKFYAGNRIKRLVNILELN